MLNKHTSVALPTFVQALAVSKGKRMIRVMYTGRGAETKIRTYKDDEIDNAHIFIGMLLVNGYKFSVDTVKTMTEEEINALVFEANAITRP